MITETHGVDDEHRDGVVAHLRAAQQPQLHDRLVARLRRRRVRYDSVRAERPAFTTAHKQAFTSAFRIFLFHILRFLILVERRTGLRVARSDLLRVDAPRVRDGRRSDRVARVDVGVGSAEHQIGHLLGLEPTQTRDHHQIDGADGAGRGGLVAGVRAAARERDLLHHVSPRRVLRAHRVLK